MPSVRFEAPVRRSHAHPLPWQDVGLLGQGAARAGREGCRLGRTPAHSAGRSVRSGLPEAQPQRRGSDAGARRQDRRRVDRHHALRRRGVSRSLAHTLRSRRARQAAHDHQADGRIRASILHDAHLRDREPCAFRPHDAGGNGDRACQGARPQALGDQAPGGRARARGAARGRGAAPAGTAAR